MSDTQVPQGATRHRVVIASKDDEDARSIASDIEREGAQEIDVIHEGAGFFPIPVFAAIVIGWMSIAGFVAWLRNWEGTRGKEGVLLRVAENGEISVQSLPIPYGQVVLVTKDGQWLRYEDTDKEKLSDLVTKLAAGIAPGGGTPTSASEVGAGEGAGEGASDEAAGGDAAAQGGGDEPAASGDDQAR